MTLWGNWCHWVSHQLCLWSQSLSWGSTFLHCDQQPCRVLGCWLGDSMYRWTIHSRKEIWLKGEISAHFLLCQSLEDDMIICVSGYHRFIGQGRNTCETVKTERQKRGFGWSTSRLENIMSMRQVIWKGLVLRMIFIVTLVKEKVESWKGFAMRE